MVEARLAEDGDGFDLGMFILDDGGVAFVMERGEAEKLWADLGRLLGKQDETVRRPT